MTVNLVRSFSQYYLCSNYFSEAVEKLVLELLTSQINGNKSS